MPTHIAHICLCLQTHQANPKAKPKECNRQRTVNTNSRKRNSPEIGAVLFYVVVNDLFLKFKKYSKFNR